MLNDCVYHCFRMKALIFASMYVCQLMLNDGVYHWFEDDSIDINFASIFLVCIPTNA